MDLLDLQKEKRFLGLEFLTWAWYASEVNSGLLDLPGFGSVEIFFEDRMTLESGAGDTRQSVTCQGKDMELEEARTALREGKKVSQARIRVAYDGRQWQASIKAESLDLSGIKLPKSFDADEEEAEGAAGKLLDRLGLLQEFVRIMEALYERFLGLRLTEAWEKAELPRLRRWLREDEGEED